MKLTFLSKCIHNATVPAILLVLASVSLSYGMTPRHILCNGKSRKQLDLWRIHWSMN